MVKKILKKNKASDVTISDKTTVIKSLWYWNKDRMEYDRIEKLEINSPKYGQVIFNKGAKDIQWEKNILKWWGNHVS